jgi:hypothetical protein
LPAHQGDDAFDRANPMPSPIAIAKRPPGFAHWSIAAREETQAARLLRVPADKYDICRIYPARVTPTSAPLLKPQNHGPDSRPELHPIVTPSRWAPRGGQSSSMPSIIALPRVPLPHPETLRVPADKYDICRIYSSRQQAQSRSPPQAPIHWLANIFHRSTLLYLDGSPTLPPIKTKARRHADRKKFKSAHLVHGQSSPPIHPKSQGLARAVNAKSPRPPGLIHTKLTDHPGPALHLRGNKSLGRQNSPSYACPHLRPWPLHLRKDPLRRQVSRSRTGHQFRKPKERFS